jgi:peptide/nickel transport system substrate-binding protein
LSGGAGLLTFLVACAQPPAPSPSAPSKPAETAKPAGAAKPAEAPKPAEGPSQGPSSTAAKPAGPKLLTIAQDVEPLTLDPHGDTGTLANNVFRHMFDPLIRRDDKLQLEGAVAESWKNLDPLTWEFKLRKGIKFHDGSELTASDVKFSFDRGIDPQLNVRARSYLAVIAKTEVVDLSTVRVITKEPDVLLPIRMTTYAYVLPEKAFNATGPEGFASRPIGSGPFKFVEWAKDQQIVLDANKEYWGGAPKVDRLVFKSIPEASTRMAALKTGQADAVNKVPIQEIEALKADDSYRVATIRSNRVAFVGMDTFHPPFDNVKLRQAVNHAVDVDAILKNVLGGYGVRVVLAPDMYFGASPEVKPYPYDPEKAKALLAEAGFPNGLDTQIEAPRAGMTPNDSELAQAIAGQLAKVGIRANIQSQDFGAYVQRWLAKEVRGMYLFSFGGPWLDVDAVLGAHFDSTRRAPYYNKPELDAMIAEARTSFDQNARSALYQRITQFIKDDAPWLFLFAADDIYAVNKRVKNWEPRADEAFWVLPTEVQ